jgi:hypothetical protein
MRVRLGETGALGDGTRSLAGRGHLTAIDNWQRRV